MMLEPQIQGRASSKRPNFWPNAWKVDTRSIAAFRVSLGLLLIIHAISHLRLYSELYSPHGALPSALLSQSTEIPYFPSLLTWLERYSWGFPTFAVTTAIAYLALTIGWKTRFATMASLCAFSTICHRNPYLVIGGDELIGSMLLWSCLLPMGARFSVDSWNHVRQRGTINSNVASSNIASAGALLQISILYFATAWLKSGKTWWDDGTALNRVLGMTTYRLPGAVLLEWLPAASLPWLTRAVLLLEYSLPLLIMTPVRQPCGRRIAIVFVALLHTGIALTTDTGLFSLTMISMIPLLLSTSDWEWIEAFRRRFKSIRFAKNEHSTSTPQNVSSRWSLELIALFLFIGFVQENWNRSFLHVDKRVSNSLIALPWRFAAAAQRWTMFAPDPPSYDLQITVQIHFYDGSMQIAWDNQKLESAEGTAPASRTELLWKLFMQRSAMMLSKDRQVEGSDLRRRICEFFMQNHQVRQKEGQSAQSPFELSTPINRVELWVTFVPTDIRVSDGLAFETACVAQYKPNSDEFQKMARDINDRSVRKRF